MDRETFNLTWNSFETSSRDNLKHLISDNSFVDVTLVTDDDQHIKAHKVILSYSSSVLSKMLTNNPHPHPMIYLAGTRYKHVRTMIDFIYLGQAEVFEDDLDSFMDIANKLKVKGLTKEDANNYKKTNPSSPTRQDFLELTPWKINPIISTPNDSLSELIKEESDIHETNESTIDQIHQGKTSSEKFSCDECAFTAFYKSNVNRHKRARHQGVKYPCNLCDWTTSYSFDLKKHIAKEHAQKSLYNQWINETR